MAVSLSVHFTDILIRPPSPQVSYTIPGTYRLTYDDGMSDLEDDVGTDSDVPMPTPPNPHCIRFSVTGIPCYWVGLRNHIIRPSDF